MSARMLPVATRCAVLACVLCLSSGCALVKRKAVGMVASTLASSGDVFSSDDDPELVRDAMPFALKLYESLLDSVPKNTDLLIATCSSFTQYAYAFVETEAEVLGEAQHHDEVEALRERALKLYLRAKGLLPPRDGGPVSGNWPADCWPTRCRRWRKPRRRMCRCCTGRRPRGARPSRSASTGPRSSIDFPTVRALAERALALDETWRKGALHETDDLARQPAGGARRQSPHARASTSRARSKCRRVSRPARMWRSRRAWPCRSRTAPSSRRCCRQALAIDPEKDPSNRLATLVQPAPRARAARSGRHPITK